MYWKCCLTSALFKTSGHMIGDQDVNPADAKGM